MTTKEHFYYGALRAMGREYLERVATSHYRDQCDVVDAHVTVEEGTLGDTKVSVTLWYEEVIEPEPTFKGKMKTDILGSLVDTEVASLDEEPDIVWQQVGMDTHVSTICYEIAEQLAKEL